MYLTSRMEAPYPRCSMKPEGHVSGEFLHLSHKAGPTRRSFLVVNTCYCQRFTSCPLSDCSNVGSTKCGSSIFRIVLLLGCAASAAAVTAALTTQSVSLLQSVALFCLILLGTARLVLAVAGGTVRERAFLLQILV